ncbi:WD40-like Beta Propeller Repeat [Fibrobacter sp. UWT3]|uniref:PD40 domain-containing protein n=1 Tax=Fibrobacter sp. UWT3 TaxID=1896225 RepID=UPI000BD83AC8|nr:PD40 domain-containing protein [Fibrobacter sp. UWT3]SOE78729.1 WD40-like Beta Propeller Repeat [Fibrobacter sp. UWT3]
MLFDAKKIRAKVAATLAGTLLLAGSAFAAGFYGNQSDIKWKTADTKHFQFIYPQEYTEHASALSAYAEAVYDSVVGRYKKDLPGRVNAVLNNALYSNGSAVPSENAVNLWLTNWDFKIRSSHGWLADVITHEFSHLVSIENGSKFKPSIYGVQFSYTDYYNERITSDFATFIPFTLQPLWFAEGTAQFESARMGFDAWDTHRDMLLRVAALNDTLLPLEYMHDFSDNSLFAELGPYTQGFSLVLYISRHYGEDAVPKIWTELSKPYRVTLDGALKKVIGIGEKELYEAWKKEITEAYKAQKDSLGPLVEGKKITAEAFWQDFPVVAGKHLYGVSNFGGPWFDGAVFKMPLEPDSSATDSTAKADEKIDGIEIGQISIEEEESDSTIDINDYAKSGFRAKKPWFDKGIDVYDAPDKGPILAYVTFQNRDKDGHAHFDIAVSDTNKNKLNLTHLVDAVYPAFSPKGNEVAFVRREPFSTRFVLSKVPFTADFSEYTAEDHIDIYVPDAKFKYYNIYSPKYSPDGSRIAFSFFDDVHRGIAVIDADGKNMKVMSTEGYDERDVNWIDNSKIVFASNRNGIFNLIEKNIDTGYERPLTNVVGGAFTPVLAGDTLYFTQYDKDGFSLYKLQYTSVAMVNDTTMNIVEDEERMSANTVIRWACVNDSLEKIIRDSIATFRSQSDSSCIRLPVHTMPEDIVTDSIWRCTDSTSYIIDSVAYARIQGDTTCTKIPMPTKGDSVIRFYDTTYTITQRPAPSEIVLKGSPLPRIEKHIELESREFAGTERDYKPIPTVPLFIPMLAFYENAPDLTVFGDGQLKAKIGLAAIIADPLKKNTLQIGLMLEIGNGIDYINGSGLNPEQEKEFFVAWENRSTPIDFGISYTYASYTSKDTVRYEDVRANDGDSLGISNYAVPMQSIVAMAGYSPFKSVDTLQIAASYDWADFNLYEDNFAWTYQKRFSVMALFGLYGDSEGEDGTGISGQGDGAVISYQYSNSDLYRPGTFAESFVVTESGKIKPKYRNFNIHEFGLSLYGSIQSPLTGARLAAGAKLGGIFNWDTDAKDSTGAKVDTLDSYYYSAVFLEGYPYLRSSENYTRAGTKTAMAEVHYLFPVYDDWRKGFWIFETRAFYIDAFAQIGAAWNSKWFDTDKFTDHDFWDRSAGLSFRWSNKIFYSIPLDITLTFARALSRIGDDEGREGSWKPTTIDVPLLPDAIAPTRIKFTLGMGFINSWQ